MKLALFKIGKSAIFLQFFENSLNGIDMGLTWVLNIDEGIIWINNDKNIKLFGQDFIDIILETGCCIGKPKRHYLVLEVAVSSLESHFLFVALFYLYLIISIHEVKLDKLFGST